MKHATERTRALVVRRLPLLVLTIGAVGAALSGAGAAPIDYWFHWSVKGQVAHEVDVFHLPVSQQVELFYGYELGELPRIVNHQVFYGGVPQAGDIDSHLARVAQDVAEAIPSPDWGGYAVIDYEAWTAHWNGINEEYKVLSRQLVEEQFGGDLSEEQIETIARAQFEMAAQAYLVRTIKLCQELRPNAKWGYFLFSGYLNTELDHEEDLQWFWDLQDAFYPSIYASRYGMENPPDDDWHGSFNQYMHRIETRVHLCLERGSFGQPVLPYGRWRYHATNDLYGDLPLNKFDLDIMLTYPDDVGASGVMIWDRLHTEQELLMLEAYIESPMAPVMSGFHSEWTEY